jgi:catechol 2,3-dioxygenase-like lactoylglutathione lyase family enzyme
MSDGARPPGGKKLFPFGAALGSLLRGAPPPAVPVRIRRITRVVRDVFLAEEFYQRVLGFTAIRREAADLEELAALGATDNDGIQSILRLGDSEIALLQFMFPGEPAPEDARSNDLWFQHLAIVVADIDAAFRHISAQKGWHPISQTGPQTLPPANGSVRAYKFRDPDQHPLELLWFPPGQGRALWQTRPGDRLFLGIDHSAVSVSAGSRSLDFYRGLGFRVASRSVNRGAPQARLDSVPGAHVHVTSLRPPVAEGAGSDPGSGMGLELLAYHPPGRPLERTVADFATDWITLTGFGGRPRTARDPDGHILLLK